MKNPLEFSLRVFAPILVILLPPLLVLLPSGVINFLLAALGEFSSLTSALQFSLWGLGPILFSISLIWVGVGLYSLNQSQVSLLGKKAMLWIVFTISLFLVFWFDLTLIGSISASDKSLTLYLRTTAQMAGILTLFGQVGVFPWLGFTLRTLPDWVNPLEKKEDLLWSRFLSRRW